MAQKMCFVFFYRLFAPMEQLRDKLNIIIAIIFLTPSGSKVGRKEAIRNAVPLGTEQS